MEQTKKLNNGDRAIKWQDLTKVLRVGDTVYSSIFGEGIVLEKRVSETYPFVVQFKNQKESFTKYGFWTTSQQFPCITNIPFNPLTDPFPTPKFEPIVGEWYAFWDNNQTGFGVYRFGQLTNKYYNQEGMHYENCAPIEEALEIFKAKYPANEQS